MAEYYYGEIIAGAFNYAPTGFLPCDGRWIAISSNTALFSILGTTYGGDGKTTFALPDLRGRVPFGVGQGAGLSQRSLGEMTGAENVVLQLEHLPPHTHVMNASASVGTQASPDGNNFAKPAAGQSDSAPLSGSPGAHYASEMMLAPSGGGAGHNNMQPSLGIGYFICVNGVFPPRW